MANPNIVAVTTINGKTAVTNVTTTATAIVENSVGSNTILKINLLMVSNVDGSSDGDITVDLYRSTVSYGLIKTATIPVDSSIDLLSKALYLEEGDALRTTASANNVLQAVCSYEVIS